MAGTDIDAADERITAGGEHRLNLALVQTAVVDGHLIVGRNNALFHSDVVGSDDVAVICELEPDLDAFIFTLDLVRAQAIYIAAHVAGCISRVDALVHQIPAADRRTSLLVIIVEAQVVRQVCSLRQVHAMAGEPRFHRVGQIDVITRLRQALFHAADKIARIVQHTAVSGSAGVDHNVRRRDGDGIGLHLHRVRRDLHRGILRMIRVRDYHGVHNLLVHIVQ